MEMKSGCLCQAANAPRQLDVLNDPFYKQKYLIQTNCALTSLQFSSVQLLSHVQLFATP